MEVGREDEEIRQLRRLIGYGQALYGGIEVDALVRTALEEAISVLPMDRMTISLRESTTSPLQLAGIREGARVITRGSDMTSPFAALEVQVINQGTPIYIADAAAGMRRADASLIRSIMAAPLKGASKHAEIFGVLVIGSRTPNLYSERDQRVFRELIGLTAAALSFSLDTARQRRAAARDALTNAIFAKVQGVSDVGTLLTLYTQELGRAFGAESARAAFLTDKRAAE
jgi:GAF domain-containing protein